jgi:hypothetical protein
VCQETLNKLLVGKLALKGEPPNPKP